MKNILVTGGAGFIGSNLVRFLLSQESVAHVTIFDNFSTGKWGFVPEDKRLRVVAHTIGANDELRQAMRGCDTVFHLAANADIAKAETEPTLDFWQGTFLTQCVLEAMRETGVKRLFFSSGSGVYGDCGEIPVREDMPCAPISPYGAAKLASEAMILAYSHMFGIKASVFRFANVVGPNQTHGVGYDFIKKLRRDPTKLEIMGDGTQSKSYIHVDDVIFAMMVVENEQTELFDVWNVATDDVLAVISIATLAVHMEVTPYAVLSKGGSNRGWKGDVPVVRFDCSKLKSIGWSSSLGSFEAVKAGMEAVE